ncbi:hypothetical protein DL96DRAFT_1716244 [Flagelloscypha sp. PMI_526]|nr:hypothetical protein DL96DRAFT_1716244 [Flagelloscypha sp. PMI_526]
MSYDLCLTTTPQTSGKRSSAVSRTSDDKPDIPISLSSPPKPASLVYEVTSTCKGTSSLNAMYALPSGQVIYRMETSSRLFSRGKVTRIRKVVPTSNPVDEFETVAQIHHKYLRPTVFKLHSPRSRNDTLRVSRKAFILKARTYETGFWSAYGRDRIVKLPNGQEAKWSLGPRVCHLFSNDSSKQLLALFHRKGSSYPERPPSLEIFPEALGVVFSGVDSEGDDERRIEYQEGIFTREQRKVVDFILMTFAYVEKIRSERETE